jgi:nucleoside-diphosphate-sugar epimerase
MSRVLVFGGSGFIGRQVCWALVRHPEVSALTSPGRDRCDLLAGSVDDLVALFHAERPDAVVNCTGRLSGSANDLVQANTAVTAKLIEATSRYAPDTRLVRLGSAGEYGVVPRPHAVREDDPAVPVSAYGASHLAGTHLMRLASVAGDVDGVVLRVFNPIGPGLHQENMLGRAVALIREAQRTGAGQITMASLSAWRDFVDVRDLAAAVCAAVLAPRLDERVLNVASGCAVRSRHAMELLAEAAGFSGEVREQAPVPARSAAVDWMRGDISLATAQLGWAPVHDLTESIKAIWIGADGRGVDGH